MSPENVYKLMMEVLILGHYTLVHVHGFCFFFKLLSTKVPMQTIITMTGWARQHEVLANV